MIRIALSVLREMFTTKKPERGEEEPCCRCHHVYPTKELIRMVEDETNREFGLLCKPCAEVAELADDPNVGYINNLIPGERVVIRYSPDAAKLLGP